jgi:predicted GNAT family acetyltransferase
MATADHIDLAGDVDARVVDRPQRSRFELVRRGDVLGFVDYVRTPWAIALTHAEVRQELRGQGLGEQLAAGALRAIRAGGLEVIPRCPFIAGYLRKHPELAPGASDHAPLTR